MSPRFIPAEEIESAAIGFLLQHHPDDSIPIPIDEIIEFKLKIRIIPLPKLGSFKIDGFSNHEFTEIHIDDYQFSNSENRARFTLAHEIGHFVLHKNYVDTQKFKNVKEWKEFVVNDLRRDPLEIQANMFASYLLLPTIHLEEEYDKEYASAKAEWAERKECKGIPFPDESQLVPYIAKPISRIFKVSEECAENRIRNWLNRRS